MLNFPSAVRIYLCKRPADMRRSFDGLALMVRDLIKQNPLSGHLFIFRNKRGHMLKLLYWDQDGYVIWYKRLEKGVFAWPQTNEEGLLDRREFAMMLEGIVPQKHTKKKRLFM
ncbi:IS66 family insertion sequence element accessory protein TnpB [Candidatus Uhrbacteria bacterium]|nr:IS66 family insertion sequence element accessory protein TnpB [Candidatus Uhrbacteria bacterium]